MKTETQKRLASVNSRLSGLRWSRDLAVERERCAVTEAGRESARSSLEDYVARVAETEAKRVELHEQIRVEALRAHPAYALARAEAGL